MAGRVTLARGLGMFSLALGLCQLVAPRRFAALIGLRPRPGRDNGVRALGARELGAGAGLLAGRLPVAFMWLRVAGDAMDLALLGRAMADRGTRRRRAATALASVAGITAVDVAGSILVTREARREPRNASSQPGHGVLDHSRQVRKAITVSRPVEEVYAYWRRFENLPAFMRHLEEVRVLDDDGRRSRWKARAPLGTSVEWEAELVAERPNEMIAWRSVHDSQVDNAGTVWFAAAPAGRGTQVRVELEYDPPAGPLGVAIAKLTGEEPANQTAEDLRRLKQILETGEVVASEATLGGRRVRQRPAQPPESREDIPATARPAGLVAAR